MSIQDFKENSAEILRVAGTLPLIYPLAISPFVIFGTGRSLSDFAMLGVIAVPVIGGSLIVQVGLLVVYLLCLPVSLLHGRAATRGAKPRRKKGVHDPDFER